MSVCGVLYCLWCIRCTHQYTNKQPTLFITHSRVNLFVLLRFAWEDPLHSSRMLRSQISSSRSRAASSHDLRPQTTIANVPLTITKRAKKLRQKEDEIFQLWFFISLSWFYFLSFYSSLDNKGVQLQWKTNDPKPVVPIITLVMGWGVYYVALN